VPAEFHEFLPLFDKIVADRLPPHREYDHKIVLKDGFEPPFGPLYSLSRPELEALKAFLEENLDKRFLLSSSRILPTKDRNFDSHKKLRQNKQKLR
jgi:hypothetical protein